MRMALFLTALCLPIFSASAAKRFSYTEEMYQLGGVAGQGLACQAEKYDQFELLARAIMIGKAQNAQMQQEGIMQYNAGKAETFMAIEAEKFASCNEINQSFAKQKIFDSTLYSDGRVLLYDGTMITPRKTYNASKLYQKDPDAFKKAHEHYQKAIAQAQKNSKNAKKIEFFDNRYDKLKDQF